MADLRRAVELGRTLRGQAGLKVRQPLARLWLALPGGTLGGVADAGFRDELLGAARRRAERQGRWSSSATSRSSSSGA